MDVRGLRGAEELEGVWRMERELLESKEDWEDIQRRYRGQPELFAGVWDRGLLVGEISGEEKEAAIWIRGISVKENYQGQGLGTQLLKRLLAEAERKNKVVRVMPRDVCATSFYEKKGLVPVEVVLKTSKQQNWEKERLFKEIEEKDGLFEVHFGFEHGMEVKVNQDFEGEVKVVWEKEFKD